MRKKQLTGYAGLFFLVMAAVVGLHAAERTLIKNAAIFMPDGSWQADSVIIINGRKIEKTGPMKSLKPGEIYDSEYELKGTFVYPAFIDPLYKGFQKVEKKKPGAPPAEEPEQRRRGAPPREYKEPVRKPLEKRNYFIQRKAVDRLALDTDEAKELMGQGFAVVQVVPAEGIIGGTTAVISLAAADVSGAVLVPEGFMTFFFQPNNSDYPTTSAGLMAELHQLKADCSYYQKMKRLHFLHPSQRVLYQPELDILLPYFSKEKRFLIFPTQYTEQRMVELLNRQLGIEAVLVAHADVWRRKVDPDSDIILPLDFKPPEESRYAQQGEKFQEEAEEKIYPEKLAAFFKTHQNISLAAPDKGDYKTLYQNIRILMKQGVPEADVIAALTLKPARLLDISRHVGSIAPGKLANLTVRDKTISDPRTKVKMAFVEGKRFEFREPEKKEKKEKEKAVDKKKDKEKKQKTTTQIQKPLNPGGAGRDLLLKNADIYTFDRGVLKGHDLLIEDGKIAGIGQNLSAPSNAGIRIIDLTGRSVIPGIIDSHNHIGL